MSTPLESILIQAAGDGDVARLRAALAQGADSTARGPMGMNALMAAASGGHEACVALLIDLPGFDASCRVKSMEVFGPGHWRGAYGCAFEAGRSDCARAIFEHGARTRLGGPEVQEAMAIAMERSDWTRVASIGALIRRLGPGELAEQFGPESKARQRCAQGARERWREATDRQTPMDDPSYRAFTDQWALWKHWAGLVGQAFAGAESLWEAGELDASILGSPPCAGSAPKPTL